MFIDFEHRAAFSAFHSLSAFCNGGFTTLPDGLADPRLYNGNQMFYIVMTLLIIAGGIGFPNLVNFKDAFVEYFRRIKAKILHRQYSHREHVYDLNTKLVLIFTVILFVGGAIGFYLFEYNNSMYSLPLGKRIIQSAFCSATVRTAGFAVSGPADWIGVTFLMAMMLMWIGCSSQSMGGGIKINAFAAMLLNLRSIVWGTKRRIGFRQDNRYDIYPPRQCRDMLFDSCRCDVFGCYNADATRIADESCDVRVFLGNNHGWHVPRYLRPALRLVEDSNSHGHVFRPCRHYIGTLRTYRQPTRQVANATIR